MHVMDIRVVFSGNGPYQLNFSDLHIKLLNPIGQEILYTLQQSWFKYVTWTLNAGVSNSKLNIEESRNDCDDRWKSVADLVFENMQNIVRSINLTTNYKVWFLLRKRHLVKYVNFAARTCQNAAMNYVPKIILFFTEVMFFGMLQLH